MTALGHLISVCMFGAVLSALIVFFKRSVNSSDKF